MRRATALFLALLLIFGTVGCSSESADHTTPSEAKPAETTAPPQTEAPAEIQATEATEIPVETTVPVETEPALTGEVLLTVAQITFSLVGESEDIYTGTAPREEIVWESADESVVTVENGILTAVGVGTTTVTATYGEQVVSCTAGCLAATEEELSALDEATLRSPKRLPPVYENPPLDFYSDATFTGDSITYIMFQHETRHGILGHPLFLVRSGTSLNGLVLGYKNVYYQGQELDYDVAIETTGTKKIFIMLGQNDLGYRTVEETMSSWDLLIDAVRAKTPDAQFYIQSCVYEWYPTHTGNAKNEKIDTYNEQLIQYCAENGHHYIDIQKYVEDHTHRMATDYSLDQGIHLNEEGCIAWMHALNNYVYLLSIGGIE